MKQISTHKKDQRISAIITMIISLILLLCIYFYRFTRVIPKSEEVVTTMLINFGDNTNGNGEEEPAPQEGSLASEVNEQPEMQSASQAQPQSQPKSKIFTGNDKAKVKNKEKKKDKKNKHKSTSKNTKKSSAKSPSSKNNKKSSAKKSNAKGKYSGDGKGKNAIGNLLKGRGNKKGSQGKGGKSGNAGDPLGGSGNGTSKIGVDRKLIRFIPGTMNRGGVQPTHKCSASGTIKIRYTVDKNGRVISANRKSGISDPCAVRTAVAWVKKYVKAQKSNTRSTGTYTIRF